MDGKQKAKIHLTLAQHISPDLSLSSVHGEIGLSFLRPLFFFFKLCKVKTVFSNRDSCHLLTLENDVDLLQISGSLPVSLVSDIALALFTLRVESTF